MTLTKDQKTAKQCVETLIENGSRYNVDVLERIYHPRLRIVKIDEQGCVTAISRADNLDFFKERRDAGVAPLSTAAEFNYVEADSAEAHVPVTRYMQMAGRPEKSVFSIHLTKESGNWQVIRETAFVQPHVKYPEDENQRWMES